MADTHSPSDAQYEPGESALGLVATIRALIAELYTVHPDAEVSHITTALNEILQEVRSAQTIEGHQPYSVRRTRNPMNGTMNPIAPPLTIELLQDKVVGRVRFGISYEGPPDCVHGGVVAAALDEVLGRTRHLAGRNVVTGSLAVCYLVPTPVNVDLVLEAYIAERTETKMIVRGEMRHGDTVTATAEGVFIFMDLDRFTTLVQDARKAASE
ncbi:MAG: PaaI family thioesterase [Ilumatobacteraceae bacterium]|nr:PaaI family thioesterase [Ilumatobacteraceae bacterium]